MKNGGGYCILKSAVSQERFVNWADCMHADTNSG